MSAKRIYAEVVPGIENTPDDDQSRMRAYQQESEEDALKKSHQIKEGIHDFHNGGHRESPGSSCMKNEVRKAKLSRRVPLRLLWRVLRIFQSRHFLRKTIYQALLFLEQSWGVKNLRLNFCLNVVEMRGSECMITYDPGFWAEQGQKLLSYHFEHFIKFAHAMLFNWNCLASNNSDCEVLWTATSGWPCNPQFSWKSYFVMTSLFFSTELVISCFYIQIFLIVLNLLVDWELIPNMNKFLLFCSFNLLWVEIFPTSLIFNLLCFKVC